MNTAVTRKMITMNQDNLLQMNIRVKKPANRSKAQRKRVCLFVCMYANEWECVCGSRGLEIHEGGWVEEEEVGKRGRKKVREI